MAAQSGFGTVKLDEIDFQSEVPAPLAEFYGTSTDPVPTVVSWRRTTAEQALYYRDHPDLFASHVGEYILLQDGQVRWHSEVSDLGRSRRELARSDPEHALWLKYVDPEEAEGEHYAVYEHTLAQIQASA